MNIEITKKDPFKGPKGDPGKPGVGIQAWEIQGYGLKIALTDGREIIFEDLRGPKGENGNAPAIEDIVQVVLNNIKPPKDGISPDVDEIVSKVLAQIPTPKDGISPDVDEIVSKVLAQIPTPKDGVSPDVDEIVSKVLAQIPTPKDGVSPDPEVIIKEVLSRIRLPEDGKDAPFSTWIKNYDVQGTTNIEKPSNIIFKIDFDQDTAYGVTAKIIGRGPSKLNFFYAEKHALFYKDPKGSVVRADSDVAVFSPRRSNPALNFEIQPTLTGIQVIAFGLEDEEISWKGELSIAST